MIQNKLVESWLDNQGERRYQPALIQLLIAEGWSVLHNTRHSPLEFGKDVIARDPHGKLCALQLKGNPGSRLTKSEATYMLPQFLEAIESEIPLSYGRVADEKHRTIIVTNGEIDEEARELFDRVAERTANPICASDGVSYWTRGELLNRFSSKAQEIWPADIAGLTEAIKLYGEDGFTTPAADRIGKILRSAVGVSHSEMKAPERRSKITRIFLITEILKDPWYRTSNHYVLYQISALAATFAIQFSDDKSISLISQFASVALGHASDLFCECKDSQYDPRYNSPCSNPLSEIDIFVERARLIADATAILVLAGQLAEGDQNYARTLIEGSFSSGCMWGQFTVPSLIVRHWAWRKLDATIKPEASLISLLAAYLTAAETHRVPDMINNAAPYYRYEQVLFQFTDGKLGEESDISQDNTRYHMSFGKAIFYMLALRNLKQSCKALWSRFSKMIYGSTEVNTPDFFSAEISETGETIGRQFYSMHWHDLVSEAIDACNSEKLSLFRNMHWLAAAYISLAPHRAEFNLIMALDAKFIKTWYNVGHRPGDPVAKDGLH